jgi:hypothetical protein
MSLIRFACALPLVLSACDSSDALSSVGFTIDAGRPPAQRVDLSVPFDAHAPPPDLAPPPADLVTLDLAPPNAGTCQDGAPLLRPAMGLPGLPLTSTGTLAAGDIDGDGHVDLVSTVAQMVNGQEQFALVVAFGRGDGSFPKVMSYMLPGFPEYSLAVGDFNGDGLADVAVGQDLSVLVMIAGKGRTLAVGKSYPTVSGGSMQLLTGDLDEDGRIDLVQGTGSVNVEWLRGHGDGTFDPSAVVAKGITYGDLSLGHVDGDRHLDLVGGTLGGGSVTVAFGDGRGAFPRRTTIPDAALPGLAGGAEDSTLIADVNGDGKPDVLFGEGYFGVVRMALGHGDGSFDAPIQVVKGGDMTAIAALAAIDIDGRNGLDLVTADFRLGAISVDLNRGNGTFDGPVTFAWGFGAYPDVLVAGDYDEDGHTDVATAQNNFIAVEVYLDGCW